MREVTPIAIQVPEAAQLVGVPTSTVRYWCASGMLPAVKIGKAWLIRLDTLDRMTRAKTKEEEPAIAS